jgi:hypothetical protein
VRHKMDEEGRYRDGMQMRLGEGRIGRVEDKEDERGASKSSRGAGCHRDSAMGSFRGSAQLVHARPFPA